MFQPQRVWDIKTPLDQKHFVRYIPFLFFDTTTPKCNGNIDVIILVNIDEVYPLSNFESKLAKKINIIWTHFHQKKECDLN